jgi:hypothetical protein
VGWWATKLRQTQRHLLGRVREDERAELATWLDESLLALFDSMHRADQRHGLDVVAKLRRSGYDDPELLLAGLLHDCAKGPRVRLVHRVAWSLGERYGHGWLDGLARLPGFAAAFERLRHHAMDSAELALAAGCGPRTAQLIAEQAAPGDPAAVALRLADEAS